MFQRRMRFAVMAENDQNKRTRINVDITEDEAAIVDKVLPQIKQNLAAGLPMVSKLITPFAHVSNLFLEAQKGRGNSPVTIRHYEQTIRKLNKFFCWVTDTDGKYDTLSQTFGFHP